MNRQKRKWHRTVGAVLATILLVGTSGSALAADTDNKDIGLQVEVGFDGAYTMSAWIPLQVTVENNGADISGRLAVTKDPRHAGGFLSSYEKVVVLPKGTSKTYTLEVPAMMLNETVAIELLDTEGNLIESKSNVTGTPVREGILLGGLVREKDDLGVFSLINSHLVGGKVTSKSLAASDLPERPELLNSLDLLVINHAPSEQLTPEQIAAVETWVQHGGHLLLSGGADYSGGAGQFAKISPVAVSGTQELTDLSALKAYSGVEANATRLTVSAGTLDPNARALVQAGDVPLLATRQVGAGKVLYVAYDLSAEPLASWQGNKDMWNRLLGDAGFQFHVFGNGKGDDFHYKMQIMNNSSLFENIAPAVTTSAAIFGGYILLVGPLMYFALRRFNKREWGWVLIPSTAAIWALGIYLVGTDQRSGDAITQLTSVVDLKTEQAATVTAGASFVVNKGGDYTVRFAPGMQTLTNNMYSGGNPNNQLVSNLLDEDRPRVSFRDVEFWSARSVLAEGVVKDRGLLKGDLHIDKDGKLSGSILNNSTFDLENAHLLIGDELVKVGDFKQGETAKVEHQMGGKMPSMQGISQKLFDAFAPYNMNGGPDEYPIHRALLSYGAQMNRLGNSAVHLFAFSTAPIDVFELEDLTSNNQSYLSFVHQEMSLTYDDLGTEKPLGLLRPRLTSIEGNVSQSDQGVYLQMGSVVLEYNVKVNASIVPQKVTTNLDQAAYAMLAKEFYNWQTDKWDTVSKQNTPTMSGDETKKYVSESGMLLIRVKGTTENNHHLPYPNIGVEGKVAP